MTEKEVQELHPESVGLPMTVFLYTTDQIASQLSLTDHALRTGGYLFYDGRTTGTQKPDEMLARNIAAPGTRPEWRVAQHEFIRWMKRKGFRIYSRSWVTK